MDKIKKKGAKKYSQQELRRIMLEQKTKIESSKIIPERITSPLSKYDSAGNLTCIICRTIVKSASVWKVHVNSKNHKQNVEATKKLKELLVLSTVTSDLGKCDSGLKKAGIHAASQKVKETAVEIIENSCPSLKLQEKDSNVLQKSLGEDVLPEKFFDDPVRDAKIRNSDYKDPQDEEWERFQKEIKKESSMSNAILAGEHDEAAVERQMEEIDDQMKRWAKVLNLVEKKEQSLHRVRDKSFKNNNLVLDEEDEIDTFDEFPDWRAKKFCNRSIK